MKKILAVALLIIAVILLIISSIDDLTRAIASSRYDSTAWSGSEKYQYGDLYGLSYLAKFRVKKPQGVNNLVKVDTITQTRNIDLYAMTDSYTWGILEEPALFNNVNHIKFAVSNERQILPVTLDKTKKNILILESSERNVRALFSDTAYLKRFLDVQQVAQQAQTTQVKEIPKKISLKFKIKEIDPNIEFNTWDYRFLTPIKQLKAQLTHKLFNRVNPDVYVSPDEKYLLYGQTIDTTYIQSSFKPIGKKELNNIINAINNTANYYKAKGFDEVYLAIIPNPVTVLYPTYQGNIYNQLIPLIQNNKTLKCKVVDAYAAFKGSNHQLFCTSDTHWNYNGEKLWVELMNRELRMIH
jgi:hypothetical protein